jgi:hypothetical protein
VVKTPIKAKKAKNVKNVKMVKKAAKSASKPTAVTLEGPLEMPIFGVEVIK